MKKVFRGFIRVEAARARMRFLYCLLHFQLPLREGADKASVSED